jgi:hypothetical protein
MEEKDVIKKKGSLLDRYKKYIISAPEYPDSTKYIREQREQK